MDELNTRKSIEIKESRSGEPVPVVNGIFLHSIYSPEKEAQAFARDYKESIARRPAALVLGLGFGYHVQEVLLMAKKFHQDYAIFVLEPNKALIEEFKKTETFKKLSPYIKIVHAENAQSVFEMEEFVMFLSKKPAIIKHDPSYNLGRGFYQKFLTFKASKNVSDYRKLLSQKSSEMLSQWDGSLDEGLQAVMKKGRIQNKNDYFFFLMNAVVESSQENKHKA